MRSLFAVPAIAMLPALALSQPAWERVERLRPNETITVYLLRGEVLKGKVISASSEGVSLIGKGGKAAQAARDDVARVTKRSRGKGALWGVVIGFGIAAPVGAYAGPYLADWGNPSSGVRLRHGAGWGLFFGGIGAGIGALAGTENTVYRATAPATRRPKKGE